MRISDWSSDVCSSDLVRAGGTLVSIVGPAEARPVDGLAVDFVVVPDRAQLSEIARRVRDGRLRTNIGNVSTLDDAVAALNPTFRRGIGLEALQQALGALAVLQILAGRRGILQLILQHAFEVRLGRDIMPGAGHLERPGDAGNAS